MRWTSNMDNEQLKEYRLTAVPSIRSDIIFSHSVMCSYCTAFAQVLTSAGKWMSRAEERLPKV